MQKITGEEVDKLMQEEDVAYHCFMGGIGDVRTNRLIFALKDEFFLFEVGETVPRELIELQNKEAEEYIQNYDYS